MNRIVQYPGAALALEPMDFMTPESLGGGVKPGLLISQLEIGRDSIEQAIETANQQKAEVLLKPSPACYLKTCIYPMIVHLIMNETEAVLLSDCELDDIQNRTGWTKIAQYFLNLGVKNAVLTLGERGAYYFNESGSGYVEAEKNCNVIDTSGAECIPRRLLRLHRHIRVFSLTDTNIGIIGTALWVLTQRITCYRSKRANETSRLPCSTDAKR